MRAWFPAFAYMGLIFTLSSMRIVAPAIELFPFQDKGVHFVEYGVLGFLCASAALRTWRGRSPPRVALVGALLATAWGLSDELHQAFVPGRSAEFADLIADGLGALAGTGVALLLLRLRRETRTEA